MSDNNALKCFVIMPYGEKTDTDGKVINFDVIYRYIIADAVNEFSAADRQPVEVVRCDDIEETGSIRIDMFSAILEADIAVVDITTGNANVFYELGIRHALRDCITILIRRKVAKLPFNVQGLRVIDYDPGDIDTFDTAKLEIQNYIRNGLRSKKLDSPVLDVLRGLRISYPSKPLRNGVKHPFSVVSGGKKKLLGLVTGDLKQLEGVADVWVNSENTHMQMARYHDRSISGLIRYLGARKDKGEVVEDLVGNALARVLKEEKDWKDGVHTVQPGAVIAASSGALEDRPFRVKRIFHAATVHGIPGGGYEVVSNIQDCVWSALRELDRENLEARKVQKQEPLRSILFPVFGSGTAKGSFKKNAGLMAHAALEFLETTETELEEVYFLVYDRRQLVDGLDVMNDLVREQRLKAPAKGRRRS